MAAARTRGSCSRSATDGRAASDDYDVVTALPDSVIEEPLGRGADRGRRDAQAAGEEIEGGRRPGRTPPAGAVKAALPAPQLATLAKTSPEGDDWLVEAKFDGYRVPARLSKGVARIVTRNGNDWTAKLKSVAAAIESPGIEEAWLDGEIVVLKDAGGQDFNALQNAIDAKNAQITYLFDAPFLGGHDLRRVPLRARRAALRTRSRIGRTSASASPTTIRRAPPKC